MGRGDCEIVIDNDLWPKLHNGPIPDGLFVCHKCDNPPCVNPDHLFLGTHQENMDDQAKKGRHLKGESDPKARLTAAEVLEIRRLYKPNVVGKIRLGKQFGVSPSLIGLIVSGKRWASL